MSGGPGPAPTGGWTPRTPIILGGSGVTFGSNGTLFDGGIATKQGGRLSLTAGYGNVPAFTTPVTDTIVVPALAMHVPDTAPASMLGDDLFSIVGPPFPVGLQTALASAAYLEIPSRYLHQGAYLNKMLLRFRVVVNPGAVPAIPLSFTLNAWNLASTAQETIGPTSTMSKWLGTHSYPTGSYMIPDPAYTPITGYFYKATTGGTSGSVTANIWPVVIGQTYVDGSVTWTCWGKSGQLPNMTGWVATTATMLTPAQYFAAGAVQTLELDFDQTLNNTIDHTAYRYVLSISGAADVSTAFPQLNLILHSVEIDMVNILDTRFE